MPPQEFWQGIDQFNSQEFYACHDTLEALWMDSSEPSKKFYQGILQIAVACHHLNNHNWRGAVILLGEGVRRLSDYQPFYEGIDTSSLLDQSLQLLEALQKIQPEEISNFVKQIKTNNSHIYLPTIAIVKPTTISSETSEAT